MPHLIEHTCEIKQKNGETVHVYLTSFAFFGVCRLSESQIEAKLPRIFEVQSVEKKQFFQRLPSTLYDASCETECIG